MVLVAHQVRALVRHGALALTHRPLLLLALLLAPSVCTALLYGLYRSLRPSPASLTHLAVAACTQFDSGGRPAYGKPCIALAYAPSGDALASAVMARVAAATGLTLGRDIVAFESLEVLAGSMYDHPHVLVDFAVAFDTNASVGGTVAYSLFVNVSTLQFAAMAGLDEAWRTMGAPGRALAWQAAIDAAIILHATGTSISPLSAASAIDVRLTAFTDWEPPEMEASGTDGQSVDVLLVAGSSVLVFGASSAAALFVAPSAAEASSGRKAYLKANGMLEVSFVLARLSLGAAVALGGGLLMPLSGFATRLALFTDADFSLHALACFLGVLAAVAQATCCVACMRARRPLVSPSCCLPLLGLVLTLLCSLLDVGPQAYSPSISPLVAAALLSQPAFHQARFYASLSYFVYTGSSPTLGDTTIDPDRTGTAPVLSSSYASGAASSSSRFFGWPQAIASPPTVTVYAAADGAPVLFTDFPPACDLLALLVLVLLYGALAACAGALQRFPGDASRDCSVHPLLLCSPRFWGCASRCRLSPGSGTSTYEVANRHSANDGSLRVLHLTKRFGTVAEWTASSPKATAALRDVNFVAGRSTLAAVYGATGAGKATLLRLLAGSLAPSSGVAMIAGVDLGESLTAAHTTARGYCPRDGHVLLHNAVSAREHASLMAVMQGVECTHAREHAARALQRAGLGERGSASVATLSPVYQRRFAVALAAVGDPRMVLIDAPTARLDRLATAEICSDISLMRGLDRVLIVATDDAEVVDALADTVVALASGAVRCSGSIHDLRAASGVKFTVRLMLRSAAEQAAAVVCLRARLPEAAVSESAGTPCVVQAFVPAASALDASWALVRDLQLSQMSGPAAGDGNLPSACSWSIRTTCAVSEMAPIASAHSTPRSTASATVQPCCGPAGGAFVSDACEGDVVHMPSLLQQRSFTAVKGATAIARHSCDHDGGVAAARMHEAAPVRGRMSAVEAPNAGAVCAETAERNPVMYCRSQLTQLSATLRALLRLNASFCSVFLLILNASVILFLLLYLLPGLPGPPPGGVPCETGFWAFNETDGLCSRAVFVAYFATALASTPTRPVGASLPGGRRAAPFSPPPAVRLWQPYCSSRSVSRGECESSDPPDAWPLSIDWAQTRTVKATSAVASGLQTAVTWAYIDAPAGTGAASSSVPLVQWDIFGAGASGVERDGNGTVTWPWVASFVSLPQPADGILAISALDSATTAAMQAIYSKATPVINGSCADDAAGVFTDGGRFVAWQWTPDSTDSSGEWISLNLPSVGLALRLAQPGRGLYSSAILQYDLLLWAADCSTLAGQSFWCPARASSYTWASVLVNAPDLCTRQGQTNAADWPWYSPTQLPLSSPAMAALSAVHNGWFRTVVQVNGLRDEVPSPAILTSLLQMPTISFPTSAPGGSEYPWAALLWPLGVLMLLPAQASSGQKAADIEGGGWGRHEAQDARGRAAAYFAHYAFAFLTSLALRCVYILAGRLAALDGPFHVSNVQLWALLNVASSHQQAGAAILLGCLAGEGAWTAGVIVALISPLASFFATLVAGSDASSAGLAWTPILCEARAVWLAFAYGGASLDRRDELTAALLACTLYGALSLCGAILLHTRASGRDGSALDWGAAAWRTCIAVKSCVCRTSGYTAVQSSQHEGETTTGPSPEDVAVGGFFLSLELELGEVRSPLQDADVLAVCHARLHDAAVLLTGRGRTMRVWLPSCHCRVPFDAALACAALEAWRASTGERAGTRLRGWALEAAETLSVTS
jgi:ABC-type multidrug transport system ATPase subunit